MVNLRFSRADQIALERRLVAEIGEFRMKYIARLARRRTSPGNLPFFRIQQPGDRAQQGGLAGAVFSGEQHTLARLRREAHAAQHMAITAPQVQP